MMDLESAIKHCEEVMMENLEKTKDRNASDPIAINCFECADEHRQLAAWLKELKAYKVGESRSEIPNTCGDAISREAAVDAIYDLCGENVSLKENPWRDNPHMDAVVDALENLPSVTPQQRTGRWKFIVYDVNRIGHYECSECHWNVLMNVSAYCPNCGARMEVEE